MQRRWVVIREKDGAVLGQFASRYAAMVFAERQADGPHTLVDQVQPPQTTTHTPEALAG
jgi:hypothetical protein